MKMKSKIKVLLADDHPMLREGLRSSLEPYSHIQIVGEACDGREAVRKAIKLRPHIVLMDISMPRMNGLAAAGRLKKLAPKIKVIMLTVHENKAYVFEMIRAGGKAYLLKDSSPDQIRRAIESVHRGEFFFSSNVSQMVLNEYSGKTKGGETSVGSGISQREQEVLGLIAEGLSNKEIAQRLFLSVRTIETHREHIMKKLDIHSAAGLTRYAISHGLIRVKEAPRPQLRVHR